jgi:hypothetical protein
MMEEQEVYGGAGAQSSEERGLRRLGLEVIRRAIEDAKYGRSELYAEESELNRAVRRLTRKKRKTENDIAMLRFKKGRLGTVQDEPGTARMIAGAAQSGCGEESRAAADRRELEPGPQDADSYGGKAKAVSTSSLSLDSHNTNVVFCEEAVLPSGSNSFRARNGELAPWRRGTLARSSGPTHGQVTVDRAGMGCIALSALPKATT